MRIIIEVKDTATLERIEQLSRYFDLMQHPVTEIPAGFSDVIKSISKEWN